MLLLIQKYIKDSVRIKPVLQNGEQNFQSARGHMFRIYCVPWNHSRNVRNNVNVEEKLNIGRITAYWADVFTG